jgi:hypothetical protein
VRSVFFRLLAPLSVSAFIACASSDEGEGIFPDDNDAGSDVSIGSGGSGFGGASGAPAGGAPSGGASGAPGGGAPSSGGSTGTCNPTFCPSGPQGSPCCVTLNGPCGYDVGVGCQQAAQDF